MSSTQIQVLDFVLPVGSLEAYIRRVNTIPILSINEEVALAIQYREKGDLEAAKKLVMAHLRFVVKVARSYLGYGLHLADLIQEGNIGLMKAVKRFDPKKGARLVSFAIHWIKAEIHEFILRNWRIIKIATTKTQRKLFFNLRKLKTQTGWTSSSEAKKIAETLKVDQKALVDMEERLYSSDVPMESHQQDLEENNNDQIIMPIHYLKAGSEYNPDSQLETEDLETKHKKECSLALAKLDPRSKAIIQARWLDEKKKTLQELANLYGISVERIRQLEEQALEKLKKILSRSDATILDNLIQ